MNQFYYWQSDVIELRDDLASSGNELNALLDSYSAPESLFEDLLYEDDRFSWIVDDYEELEASFQGISKSFGYEFGLINPSGSEVVYGFVKYVVEGSPADNAEIVRGDIFTKVDGQSLNTSNYVSLLFEQDSYTLTFGEVVEGDVTSIDKTASVSAIELTENPIFLSQVIDLDGINVGYLVYNQFVNNDQYHSQLNAIFGEFKNESVSELVLDLRYNPGGSIFTTQLLASMIYGAASSSQVFGSVVYNEKLTEIFAGEDLNYYFYETIPSSGESLNRLSINRVFILTSSSTASASELIIAGLSPYMEVVLIGDKTVGKNVGSVTLYDSPSEAYLDKGSDLNGNHKYAIQPIISQLANSNNFTDYINGFEPDVLIQEKNLVGEIKQLGDTEEQLLASALNTISGVARFSAVIPKEYFKEIYDSKDRKKYLETIRLDSKKLSISYQ